MIILSTSFAMEKKLNQIKKLKKMYQSANKYIPARPIKIIPKGYYISGISMHFWQQLLIKLLTG